MSYRCQVIPAPLQLNSFERVAGIEPACLAWEASVLKPSYRVREL